MEKGIKIISVFLIVISFFFGIKLTYAQPKTSKQKIPSDISAEVEKQLINLYSSDPIERAYAAYHLGEMGGRASSAVPFLIEMFDDDAALKWVSPSTGVEEPTTPGKEAGRALVNIGSFPLETIIALLKDGYPAEREVAAFTLGKLKGHQVVEPLIAALKDQNPDVRRSAAEALGNIENPLVAETLTTALKDESESVRISAVVALGNFKDPRAIEPLLSATFEDKEGTVARFAIAALGEIENPRAEEALITILKSKSQQRLWESAAGILAHKGCPGAIEPLIDCLKDENWNIQEYAINLRKSGLDSASIESLINSGKDIDNRIRQELGMALYLITRQDFGSDHAKWHKWWQENKEKVGRNE